MGAPCNIDMNTYADDEYIIGVDFANKAYISTDESTIQEKNFEY